MAVRVDAIREGTIFFPYYASRTFGSSLIAFDLTCLACSDQSSVAVAIEQSFEVEIHNYLHCMHPRLDFVCGRWLTIMGAAGLLASTLSTTSFGQIQGQMCKIVAGLKGFKLYVRAESGVW